MGLMVTLLLAGSLGAAELPGAQNSAFDEQLSKECASLITTAVKSSYGWGWAEPKRDPKTAAMTDDDQKGKTAKRKSVESRAAVKPVQAAHRTEIDVLQTAAAGLVLFLAGERLDDPALSKAGTEAARALAAVQQPSGQLPAVGVLAANAGGHDEPMLVPSRAATCAAIGLFSAILQGSDKPDPRFVSALTRAAGWLSTQQTQAGAFAVAYPRNDVRDASRVVRLDTPDYRDATAALLLASRVLGEPAPARRANDTVTALLAMRVRSGDERVGALWVPGYRLTGEGLQHKADLPYALDMVAAQYSMQTLLIACLLSEHWDDRSAADALIAASKSIDALPRRSNERWHRHYHLLTRAPLDKESLSNSSGKEEADASAIDSDASVLAQTLTAANAVATQGTERFLTESYSEKGIFWPPNRIGMMLCGLGSDRLALSLPRSKEEAQRYVKEHAATWLPLEGEIPPDVETRIRRVHVLLLRSALEDVN